jgi:glycogen debranching enzyme
MEESLKKSLLEELWDGHSFRLKDAITGETRKSTSLFRLLPLVAAERLPKEVVEKMVKDLSKHLSPWGLATEELESSLYESDGYWRGPIWSPPTLLIESGLRAAGYTELANNICERFIKLCEAGGFAENFNAITGKGLRDLSYTWTASAYLFFRREAAQRASSCSVNRDSRLFRSP